MLVDRGELWFRVLATRYVVERGCLRAGGRSVSSWWREIVRIRDGVDRLSARVVWGVCCEEGGGWDGDLLLD
ncbi:hypothetical protein A2U01_0058749 [Trifolium medium]|uniref:Cysteine-rich receptor-like protein kinase n=1 Tax=Trifolium medium TaxID=97028 RepID=A0A392RPN9_9FABA|nr:hypothetical protein [Trifolium medium]